MPLVFSVAPNEEFNTENVIFVSMIVLDMQNIAVDKVVNPKIEFHDIETGETGEMEGGIVGVHGMNHGERMRGLGEIVKNLFAAQKKR